MRFRFFLSEAIKVAYHGTNSEKADRILKTGFDLKRAGEKSGSKLPGVSVTVDREIANEHAQWAAEKFGGRPQVIQVDLSGLKIMSGSETMKRWTELGSLDKALRSARRIFDGAELFDEEDGVEELEILIFDPKKVRVIS